MSQILKERARWLRKACTDAEKHLWYLLRDRRLGGYKFRRQCAISPYIVDFVCLEKRLIVELDGGQHTASQCYDEARTTFLNSKGYEVLRFWNHDVLIKTEAVMSVIANALTPNPLPRKKSLPLAVFHAGEGDSLVIPIPSIIN